ncbi:hypothetical protein RJG79_07735 [Mycoplasmatota bacterium WC44]
MIILLYRRPFDGKWGNYIQKYTIDGKLVSSHNIEADSIDNNVINIDNKIILSLKNFKDKDGLWFDNGLYTYQDNTNELTRITDLGNTNTILMEKSFDGTYILIYKDIDLYGINGDKTNFIHLNELGTIINNYDITELFEYEIHNGSRFFNEDGFVFSGKDKNGQFVRIMLTKNAFIN